MIASELPSSPEIVELTETCDPETKISGKEYLVKLLKKHKIEDGIKKLFEAIQSEGSHQEVVQPERALCKSSMKRPVRVGHGQASESVNLKQALRGLCISHASELAAMNKQISRTSTSQGISGAGPAKKFCKPMVIDAKEAGQLDKSKRDFVVSSHVSDKVSESRHGSQSTTVVSERRELSSVHPVHEPIQSSSEFPCSSVLQNVEHRVSIPCEGIITASLQFEDHRKRQKSLQTGLCLSKQSLRTRNFFRKNLVQKKSFVNKNYSKQKGANNDDNCNSQTAGEIRDSALEKGRYIFEKIPPASTSNENPVASSTAPNYNTSKHGLAPCISMKSDERLRTRENGEISQSSDSSILDYSTTASHNEEDYPSGSNHGSCRHHMSNDLRWEAISCARKQHGSLGLRHFKFLRKIGGGDIATVYLCELIGTNCLFSVKVMDNDSLVSGKNMARAWTEKEILKILDHPFLPTLYADFTTNESSCLIMEYCPGGDLLALRQTQQTKCFPEKAARFYAAELLVALEYLHMLGVVYRDLKLRNILVREDGHIMLTNFSSSLRCVVNPTLVAPSSAIVELPKKTSTPCSNSSCIDPFCLQPSWQFPCFNTRKLKSEQATQVIPLPLLSFVGTGEYITPEVIKGEGHGSAVDWWAYGIFLYELLYGETPFKGLSNEEAVSNIAYGSFDFPQFPIVSSHARDLIKRLLNKEAETRLGYANGAAEIKQHPFFEGLNWALIRHEIPPELPRFDFG